MRGIVAVVAVLLVGTGCSPSESGTATSEPTSEATVPTTTLVVTTTSTVAPAPSTSTTTHLGAPHVELAYGARVDWVPRVDVVWHGLPGGVAFVTIDWRYPPSTSPQKRMIDGDPVEFQITKPHWTRYVTFTAFDVDGDEIASEEVLVDGGSCSGRQGYPPPSHDDDLPSAVNATRIGLAESASRCRFPELARTAAQGGTFFGWPSGGFASQVKELDWRHGIMLSIHGALEADPVVEERDGRTVYVFTSPHTEIVIDEDGNWISAHRTP